MPTMPIEFAKVEAHGNDFLLVAEHDVSGAPEALAKTICDRLAGVGADGLILHREDDEGFVMTLWNSDGSRAEISGNGLRGLAAYLVYSERTVSPIRIATGAGPRSLELIECTGSRFTFRADMGAPREVTQSVALPLGEAGDLEVATLSMGNPHCVWFTSDLEQLSRVGPMVEKHPHFPEGTNVELVRVTGPHELEMRIWERGAGITASSGTGSAASAVAAIACGLAETPVRVHCPGGTLEVEWTPGASVQLTGVARVVAEGRYYWSTR